MERKQIYLAGTQEDQLKELAAREHTTVSALIREAVAIYLVERLTPEIQPEDHPLWGLIGIVDDKDAPIDGAENHDQQIYSRKQ